jgi:hypothetical protein
MGGVVTAKYERLNVVNTPIGGEDAATTKVAA